MGKDEAVAAATAGRTWEASARGRLERNVARLVKLVRTVADEIERETARDIANAARADRPLEFQTYPRVVGNIANKLGTLSFNGHLDSLIDAAAEAEAARIETLAEVKAITNAPSLTREADKLAGAVNALAALERAAKGWADGAAENDEARGVRDRKPSDQQEFVLADILNMIDDAAREVGVEPVYSERSKKP